MVSDDGILLDIGANLGIMTYHLSKKFQERKVFAIEPMPDNLAVLNKIVDTYQLDNVDILPLAVGDENTTLEMVLPLNGKVKMQGLAHVVHDTINEWNTGDRFEVKCIKLDDQFNGHKVAGIKMDIENFEFFALKGGSKIIAEHKPVIYLELWPNENRDKCFDLLKHIGYEANVIEKDKIVSYDASIHTKQNFIFMAKKHD